MRVYEPEAENKILEEVSADLEKLKSFDQNKMAPGSLKKEISKIIAKIAKARK